MESAAPPVPDSHVTPSREVLLRMLRFMKLHRAIEDRLEIAYRQGKLVGPLFVGRGQEAIGVGAAVQLEVEDVIFPSHRDLGAFLAKGTTARQIFLQYLGRRDGPTRGRDANLHMGDWRNRVGSFISHMGDTVPVAAGVAFSFKSRNQPQVVMCFNGDGATSRGDWHEGLNLASVLGLPVIYVCVNNGFAYSTPLSRQMAVDTIAERASGYGMPVHRIDGNDVLAVYQTMKEAIGRARSGKGPSFIECVTYRMTGHGAHDPADYVPEAFLDEGARNDPIEKFVAWLGRSSRVSPFDIDVVYRSIDGEVDKAWADAEAAELPSGPETLLDVFAE